MKKGPAFAGPFGAALRAACQLNVYLPVMKKMLLVYAGAAKAPLFQAMFVAPRFW
jgi:hypothetical protein